MSTDPAEIARLYSRAWDGDAPDGLLDQIVAADVIDHNPATGQAPGREGIRALMAMYHGAFPDVRFVQDEVIVSGDKVVVRWSATATHDGDDFGIPATHRPVQLTGIDIVRIVDGLIVERWGEADGYKLRKQLMP